MAASRVTVEIDHQLRRVTVAAGPLASGRQVSRAVCPLLSQQPFVTGYDFLYDFTSFSGDATNADLEEIRSAYVAAGGGGGGPTYTCFATRDALFSFWAAAMDELFPGRRHMVVATLHDAVLWLDAANDLRRTQDEVEA